MVWIPSLVVNIDGKENITHDVTGSLKNDNISILDASNAYKAATEYCGLL